MHAHSRVTVHFEPDVEFSAGFDPGDIKTTEEPSTKILQPFAIVKIQ